MKIGFDLDKIFIDYPPFVPASIIDSIYKKKTENTLLYRIPKRPEQILRRFTHYPFFRPAIKENILFLRKISSLKKHQYYLISGRFGFLRKTTEQLLKKHTFDKIFNKMFFNFDNKQPHVFKEKVINSLHLDCYIDDDLPMLEYLAKKNTKTKFFWLSGQTKINPKFPNITKIHTLSEIESSL
jgi:hypothetical protein